MLEEEEISFTRVLFLLLRTTFFHVISLLQRFLHIVFLFSCCVSRISFQTVAILPPSR